MYVLLWILGLFAAVVAVAVLAAARERRRSARMRASVTLEKMPDWVHQMLRRNAPGSSLVFDANGREGFLQLALTGREGGWRRVEFGLPDTDWSHESFALAAVTLGAGAAECHVEEDPGNTLVPRFLRIILEGDSANVGARAAALLRSAAQILGFRAGQTFTVSGGGTDHPDYWRTGADEFERRFPGPRWFTRRIAASMRTRGDELQRELDAPAPARTRLPHARRRVPAKRRPRQ
ncbi:MAG: hypothetical protein ACJ8GN_10415 [Longimicrobiaceae bacterium]